MYEWLLLFLICSIICFSAGSLKTPAILQCLKKKNPPMHLSLTFSLYAKKKATPNLSSLVFGFGILLKGTSAVTRR